MATTLHAYQLSGKTPVLKNWFNSCSKIAFASTGNSRKRANVTLSIPAPESLVVASADSSSSNVRSALISALGRTSTSGKSQIGCGADVGASLSQNAICQASELTSEREVDATPL